MEAKEMFKVLENLKKYGEYYDGNTHYWVTTRYEKDGDEFKAYKEIVADISEEKYTEQITWVYKND